MAVSCHLIVTSSCGHTHLRASDGTAWAGLASHGQTLTVCYLARFPPDKLEKTELPLDDSLSPLTISGETEKTKVSEIV